MEMLQSPGFADSRPVQDSMLKLSICSTLVPAIKMRALMWQYCGKLKYCRMMDKWVKTSSSVILQGLYLQTSLGVGTVT